MCTTDVSHTTLLFNHKLTHSLTSQSLHPRPQRLNILQPDLRLTKKRQLSKIQCHSPYDRRRRTSPQRADAFVARDAAERVEDAFVVCALGEGFEPVGLHAD